MTVLDPAGGTLTFLAEAAKLAVQEFVAKYGEGSKAKFIEDHILQHFFAFELMMAPYAAGHLKMGYLLEELGHKLSGDERFQFYLTNTLEMEELDQTSLPGMASLSEESHLAGKGQKGKTNSCHPRKSALLRSLDQQGRLDHRSDRELQNN